MKNKTIIVSGAAGFIPSTLSEYYLKKGSKVIGFDNYITGSRSNIDILNKYDNFKFYECNIYEQIPLLKREKVDYIFSMASPASPVDFEKIPIEILRVNSEGTLKLLELAKEKNARFLDVSTSEVYGDPEIHPQSEDYRGNVNIIGPRSCYDESKRFAESLTINYRNFYKVDTRIVRIFNTYGPRMRSNDGRVIPNFINQALRGENLMVYGDGSQTRSFCYVDDMVEMLNAVMMSEMDLPVNCGNPDEITILECAKKIVQVLGSKSKIICSGELPEDDPKKRKPNISRLETIYDRSIKFSFEDGIKKTASYFKNYFKK